MAKVVAREVVAMVVVAREVVARVGKGLALGTRWG